MSQEPVNIAAYLSLRATENPDLLAVSTPISTDKNGKSTYNDASYRELDTLCDRYVSGLADIGIKPGMRCALMVKPSLEFFTLTFALLKMGAVLVCIDPGMGLKNMKACLEQSKPHAFIGIAQAHIARCLFSWPRCKINVWVTRSQRKTRFGIPTQHALIEPNDKPDNPLIESNSIDHDAAILFTSGSTGTPKGVCYQHRQFLAQVKYLQKLFGIEVGERDLCTFPLFALFAPALGMSSIIPDMDFTKPGSVNPLHVITPIQSLNITNMFGSPALLKQVARYQENHPTKLPSLNRVISAGAPARPDVLKSFSKMLNDDVQIYTPYGATEALPVSNVGSKLIISEYADKTNNGAGVCVGQISDGMKAFIIPISDEPISTWSRTLICKSNTIGEIVVSGPVVTKAYFRNGDATFSAKIPDHNGNIMHRMGDLGYIDDQGLLWFCGRKTQRVISKFGEHYTIPCEGIFNTHPHVERSALIPHSENGDIVPAICIELTNDGRHQATEQLISELSDLAKAHHVTKEIKYFYIHQDFPVDIRHNAKINREALFQWSKTKKAHTS